MPSDKIVTRGGAGAAPSLAFAAGMRGLSSREAGDLAGLAPATNLADKVGCTNRARRLRSD